MHRQQAVSVDELAALFHYSRRQVRRFVAARVAGKPCALDGFIAVVGRRGQRQFQLEVTTRIGTRYYQQGQEVLREPRGELWVKPQWGPAPMGTQWQRDPATFRRSFYPE